MVVWNSNLKRCDAFFWLPCVSGTHMWVLLALSTESSRIVRATTQRNRISGKQKYRVDGTWETAPKRILSSTCTHLHEQTHMKTCPTHAHRKYRLTFRIFKRGKLNIYKNVLLIFFKILYIFSLQTCPTCVVRGQHSEVSFLLLLCMFLGWQTPFLGEPSCWNPLLFFGHPCLPLPVLPSSLPCVIFNSLWSRGLVQKIPLSLETGIFEPENPIKMS